MSGTLWTKFYWSDWDTDQALKLCSLAAQGLWMRMLCTAAQHDPIGYVCIAGRPLGVTDLARLTGASETEVDALLAELVRNSVCSRDSKGRLYSRRMIRDAKKAATARKNGKTGGNPRLSNISGNPASDNHQDKGGLNTHKPEARVHKEKPPNPHASEPPGFERWWEGYPRKVAKGAARKAYAAALRKASAAELIEALSAMCWPPEARFIPHPATWLNAERWADQAAEPEPAMRRAEPDDPWPRRLLNWRVNRYWDSDWGPKPGAAGYLGPPMEQAA